MPNPSATPTPITPPRVPLIDPRTGLIDRSWYMFFLSLLNAAQIVYDNPNVGPNAETLIASYDAALQALAQNVDTRPLPFDLSVELAKQVEAAGLADQSSALLSQIAELQKQIDALNLLPSPAQGTITTVTATAPVVSSGGTAPDISMPAAGTSTNGYLTSTDWNTFNGKAPATSGTSILYGNGSGGFSNVTIGTGVTFAAGTLSATGTGGTVTSVTGTSPVVSSGGTTPAISLATGYGDTQNPYASKTANYILAAPNGAAGAPVFRALVAADVPTLNQNTTGTAAGLSVTLVATSGGTGQSSYAIGDILYASTTTALSKLADVATGNALISGGVGVAPSYGKIGLTTHVSGTLALGNGGTGGTTAATARTGIGATTVGANFFTLTNPSAITFPRINADNTVSALDAATFRTAIGAGTGTVTSVTGTAPVVSSGGATPAISMAAASSTTNGYLTSTDWITFNTRSSNTQEIQTATSGQTVFTLTTMTYTPGTNNLSVFVNGVNQYGPSALYAYTETNSTTVTFTTAVPVGASVKFTTTDFVSSGNNGTVTSVGLAMPSQFTVTNSPVTVNGTLTAAWASQTANTFIAAPNGVAGVPTFRVIVAADVPTLNQNTTGTAANVTGTVAVLNGGTGGTTAAAARTGIGATTVGANFFTLANPTAVTFPRINADNTVSALDAATFRTAIGAGTSSTTGTVTSVGGTGTVSGLTLTGTVTTTGNLTLGGTLAVVPANFASQTANTFLAAPNGVAGTPTFRGIVAADVPTLNQNTSGTAAGLSTTLAVASGGTGQTSAIAAFNALSPLTTLGDTLYNDGTNDVRLAGNTVASKRFLVQTGTGTVSAAPAWGSIVAGDVPTLNQNTTGTAAGLSATLVATSGGTGQSSYAVGDLLYASTTTALSKLADVATGNALISGGVGVAPSWGKIGLTTHVSGTLALGNGGTGGTTAATARTGIGATTVGANFFTLTNPTAVTFPRINADNTVSTLDAATFRTAIGAGTGSGTVTSVAALTLGTTGTNLSSTVATGTTTPVITLNVPTASAANRGALSSTDWSKFNNKQSVAAPATYAANFSVAATDLWIINNKPAAACTATLPAPASFSGRVLHFQNYQAQTLISASANVVPIGGGAAGTSILLASTGDQATLVSNGTNWIMMQYVPNNILLLE